MSNVNSRQAKKRRGRIHATLSPATFAFLAETSGYTASFLFLSAVSMGTALVLVTLVRETLRREPPARMEGEAVTPVRSARQGASS